ncbi:MAG: tetratricopeptide repeat protein [Bacteroidales bacterium]|nr:tetratricopeptide repeat protein [Bacteroidales bacterium]
MDDTTQAVFNNTFGVYYWYISEFDTAIQWFRKTLEMNEDDELMPFKAEAANNTGTLYSITGMPDSAAGYLERALEIDQNRRYQRGVNKNLYELGVLNMRKNHYQLALKYFFQLKENLRLYPDPMLELLFTTALGNVFYYLDSLDKAVAHYEKSLSLAEKLKDSTQIKMAFNNLSAAYSKMPEKLDKALYYSKEGLAFAKGKGNLHTSLALNLNVAYAYCSRGMIDSALVWYKKASGFAPYIENPYLLSAFYIRYAEALFKDGQHRPAYMYYQKALYLSLSSSSIENQRDALLGLARVDSAAKNYLQAFDYYQQAIGLDKVIYNKENSSQIAELNILHESTLKERQIKLLQEKDRNNRLLRVSGILFTSILLVTLALFIFYLRKRRQVAEQKLVITRQENETAMTKLDAKRKELTGIAYSLAKAEKLIANLKSEIQELIPKTDVDNSQQLQSLTRLLRQNKNSLKLWHEFELRFDELNDGFISKLAIQYPTLSSTELRLCAMLRLQFSNKEIAEITGRSVRTIEYTRLRIRRKMNLDEGANLSVHILTIS